jgi:uncharacterized protein Smg (DUF494 family)
MHRKIINYIKEHQDHDLEHLRSYLIKMGFHSDEIDEAIEEYEFLRSNEEDLPLFPDPHKD